MDRVVETNRRSFQRFPVTMSVPYRINSGPSGAANQEDSGTAWEEGDALNLSAGGVLLRTPRLCPEDLEQLLAERTRMSLELPLEGRTLCVTARLVWSDEVKDTGDCRLGLRFLDLDSSDQQYLWRWVLERVNE